MGCTGAAAASQQDSGSPSPTGTAQDAACGDSGGDSDTCGFASAGIDGKLALVFSCTRPAQTHPRQVSDARNLPRESSNSHMVPAAPGGQSPVAGAASPHRSMIRRALVNTSTARRGPSQEKGPLAQKLQQKLRARVLAGGAPWHRSPEAQESWCWTGLCSTGGIAAAAAASLPRCSNSVMISRTRPERGKPRQKAGVSSGAGRAGGRGGGDKGARGGLTQRPGGALRAVRECAIALARRPELPDLVRLLLRAQVGCPSCVGVAVRGGGAEPREEAQPPQSPRRGHRRKTFAGAQTGAPPALNGGQSSSAPPSTLFDLG